MFARGDFKKLRELVVFYLGGEVPNFNLHQPGACHEARFMADEIYLLTLKITSKIAHVMTEEDKSMVHTLAFFVSICQAPVAQVRNRKLGKFRSIAYLFILKLYVDF